MKKYLPYIKGALFVGIVAFLFGFASQRNELKKVSDISIKFTNGDNLFITYETVNKLLIQNYGELKSQPKENIILRELERTLKSNEMIEDADVYLTVKGALGATIKQRTPIARVNDEGVAYYVDSKGDKMPLSSNYSARVPLLSGLNNNNTREVYMLANLIFNDVLLHKQIIGIEVNKKKEFTLKTRVGNQNIKIGPVDHINAKVKKLKAFYQKVIKDKTLDKYQTINLVFKNQVVCTKK
jgi:cell division protein FtsQ